MDFTKEKFDIVIQAGQSNAEGCGKGPLDEPVYTVDGDIMHLSPEFTVTIATVDGFENLFVTYADKPFDISCADEHLNGGETAADFSLTFADKNEGTMSFEFHARQAAVDDYDNAPFRVIFFDNPST